MHLHEFRQTKWMTALEAVMNVGSGMLIAFGISQLAAHQQEFIQAWIWSGFHWNISPSSNMAMTVVLTVVSVIRGYCWRRIFDKKHAQRLHSKVVK